MAGTSSKIPIEIVSDEEIALIEAALASATSATHTPPSASKLHHKNAISIHKVSVRTKRSLFMCAEYDIEDYGNLLSTQKKKSKVADTLLHRFRNKRGLFVTDVTNTEWCEMQMELSLFHEEWKNNEAEEQKHMDLAYVFGGRKRKKNEAMRAGVERHAQLQKEVLKHVKVKVKSREDDMALKLVNFINGVNQLLFEGLTRELPIVSFAFEQGIWMVGKVDEVQMPKSKNYHSPILVEIKTRFTDTVPLEPQKRKGRIQLMCYKYLWDNLVAHAHYDFPYKQFFDYFELDPHHALCEDIVAACVGFGISALTLDDLVTCYQNTCKMLPLAHDKLVLRYESQKDKSVLHEEKFAYDDGWIKRQINNCLEFWLGHREADYVAEEEEWKCRYCDFVSECPAYTDTQSTETASSDYSSE